MRVIITGDRIRGGIYLMLLLIFILPLIKLSLYNHPAGDDWTEAGLALKYGFWGAQVVWYHEISGRYFDTIINSFNPMAYGIYWAYKLNTIVFLILLLLGIYVLVGKIFGDFSKPTQIGIGALFVVSFLLLMPNIGEGIFWQSGIYATFFPDIMTLFLFTCIIQYYRNGNRNWTLIASCFLLIAIIGSYEINMMYVDAFILALAIISIQKKRNVLFPFILLAVSIVFTLIEMKAPGVAARAKSSPDSHNFLASIKGSYIACERIVIQWISFMLLVGFLLFEITFEHKSIEEKKISKIFSTPPWLVFLACFVLMFMGMFMFCWSTGVHPPTRVENVIAFYFVLGMMYFAFSVIVRLKNYYPKLRLPIYVKAVVVLIFLFGLNHNTSMIRDNNITAAYTDLISGTASAYDKERMERYEFLMNYKGDSCVIRATKHIPLTLHLAIDSVSTGLNYEGFCIFYHKKYIRIK